MRLLAICSQDISEMTLGLQTDKGFLEERFEDTPPEGHLSVIDRFLQSHGVRLNDLSAVLVVTGPGSFTASRVSTTIGNAMAFSYNIPVVGVVNQERKPLSEIVSTVKEVPLPPVDQFAVPFYDRPANITAPRVRGAEENGNA